MSTTIEYKLTEKCAILGEYFTRWGADRACMRQAAKSRSSEVIPTGRKILYRWALKEMYA